MICRMHRWNMSRSKDEGTPINESTRRHMLRCENCQQYWHQLGVIENRLRDEANSSTIDEPALNVAATPIIPRRTVLQWSAPVFATAAVAAIALTLVAHLETLMPSDPATRPAAKVSQPMQEVAAPLAVAGWIDEQAQETYKKEAELLGRYTMGAVSHIISRITLPDPMLYLKDSDTLRQAPLNSTTRDLG